MENLFFFLATSLVLRIASPKFKRYLIGQTRCSSLLLTGNKQLFITYTKDGDKIYFNDQEENGVSYGLICVQMKQVYTLNESEKILHYYINRARKPLGIAHSVSMETAYAADQIIITDYWQDESGVDWKIKGYTNGHVVTVLYVKNIAGARVKEHDAFLNGFRFSA